jgi:hypothetical protein
MGHVLAVLTFLILSIVTCVHAQNVQPGDQVRFVERDQHIPAHPAPGDSRVHLRLVSGSEATVLRVHTATGWVEVRGEPLQGTDTVGWVTPRYPANRPGGGEPTADALGWCPPEGAPEPHPSGRLRLATWNLENLHAQDGQSTYTGSDPSVKRTATDYERIRCYVRLFEPDILAMQNDQVWADLDDGEPAHADLTALTQDMPISCRDNRFPEFIDHIVVDRRVLPWVDRTPFRQVTYRLADKAVWDQLSDPCPVLVELWIR